MANADIREAHKLLDSLFDNSELSHAQIDLIRGLVPELPKQKTLAEITSDVFRAWYDTIGSDWDKELYGDLDEWLHELHTHLIEIEDTPAAVPALPAGMRLADHEVYGRVVATGWIVSDNNHLCVYYSDILERGSNVFLPEDSLTFIDSKPAHPEFLETEADYENAPEGTVAGKDGWLVWLKGTDGDWSCDGGSEEASVLAQTGKRRVLRWGWTNE